MGVAKKIKNSIKLYRLNRCISKYKYVHLMFNDKFNKPFVDFLNRNFDPTEHLVLCKRFFREHPFPEGDNVIEIKSLQGLNFENNEKVICHSLFDMELVDYLYNHQDILKQKAYWMIWGGDLYEAPRDEKNDYVRKIFKGYLTDFDKKFAIEKYSLEEKPFYCIHAIFPITKDMIENTQKKQHDYTKIQINNSCDESTLEILDILSKFKNENIKITTILSYGQMQFKDEIIKKGKEIFEDKFEYLENYLSPDEYANYLSKNDILILNQNRQQGVGNTIASAAMGKKIFIKSEISTYKAFGGFGIKVYDTNQIISNSFEKFKRNDDFETSRKNAMKFFDDKYKTLLWKAVFDAE